MQYPVKQTEGMHRTQDLLYITRDDSRCGGCLTYVLCGQGDRAFRYQYAEKPLGMLFPKAEGNFLGCSIACIHTGSVPVL